VVGTVRKKEEFCGIKRSIIHEGKLYTKNHHNDVDLGGRKNEEKRKNSLVACFLIT